MTSLKKTTQALEILKNYEGDNPYILMLKRDMYVYGDEDAVGDFQIEYILRNHDYKPKTINRVTKIPKWYRGAKKIRRTRKNQTRKCLIGKSIKKYCEKIESR